MLDKVLTQVCTSPTRVAPHRHSREVAFLFQNSSVMTQEVH